MHRDMAVADLFDSAVMAVLVLDKDGQVVHINKTYLEILGKNEEEMMGTYIGAVTPNSRALVVTRTGKAIIGYPWIVNGYNMIGCAVPLFKDGHMAGCFAYSLFMDMWDAKDLVENLMSELNMYKNEVRSIHSARYTFDDIAGDYQLLTDVKVLAQKAALHPSITVLITGESGTGKELFAHAIHQASSRARYPFIRVNCAAIPENLLEAELFGFAEGAFTGAKRGGSPGKLEVANGGTVFLDEIGEMSQAMQSKFLVFLQEREFERLGSHHTVRVNVRIIAATNRRLEKMVEEQGFREDLYYRLNVLRLNVPSLRERAEDIPVLVKHLLPALNRNISASGYTVSKGACFMLQQWGWPGNVRELINVLERGLLLAEMEGCSQIEDRHLGFVGALAGKPDSKTTPAALKNSMREYERQILMKAMKESQGNKALAARSLDIDLSCLYKKLKQHGLNHSEHI